VYAHVNPLSDCPYDFPLSPRHMNWHLHFPNHFPKVHGVQTPNNNKNKHDSITKPTKHVSYVDVGCGFGGLLFELSKLWPDKLGVGMEIREKAVAIVKEKIMEDRKTYHNISVIHTNVMKYLCHFFEKTSLDALFFCFPDPHFKKSNIRRRIITENLLDYYGYVLKEGGIIFNVTDVQNLHEWTKEEFSKKTLLFEEVLPIEYREWPEIDLILNKTNEAKRVNEKGGNKFCCVYRKKTIFSTDSIKLK